MERDIIGSRRKNSIAPDVIWCEFCQKYEYPKDHDICPSCGQKATYCRCTRCGALWKPRNGVYPGPAECYKCHSYLYSKPRIHKRDGQ